MAPRSAERFELLKSVPGIANRSGLHLLAELMLLPTDMSVRQWVAQSGTSVNKPMRISKAGNVYVRRALFMPALVAIQHNPAVRAFYSRLVQRGKPKMKANVAVMRKLLHAIYGIFKTNTSFDPQECFPYPKAAERAPVTGPDSIRPDWCAFV
ncbi:MAG: transposase [Myxococcota bacterium]|jgi:transposase